MGILTIIKFVASFLSEMKNFYKFLKKNRFLTSNFFAVVIFLFISTYLLLDYFTKSNQVYNKTVTNNETIKYMTEILKTCGDKTSLSLAVISFQKENDFYSGRFVHALACDKLSVNTDCIVNLQQHNPIYIDDYKLDISSYNFLLTNTSLDIPYHANLNLNNQQDLSVIEYYPTINRLLKSTEWYKQGILNDIWISSILTFDQNGKKLLYVITFIQGKPTREKDCQEPTKFISEFKHFIIKQ